MSWTCECCWRHFNTNPLNPLFTSDREKRIETLFDAIKHGDEAHRAWLKQAIEDHFAGREVKKPNEL